MTAFVIADTHWGHTKSLTFFTRDGERLRPFDSVEEMDELMVENWNKVVNNTDTVYHLGDVVIPRSSRSFAASASLCCRVFGFLSSAI